MMGHEVKFITNEFQSPGVHSVIWDARNNEGKPVSAGLYLYQVSAGNFQKFKKMVLLK